MSLSKVTLQNLFDVLKTVSLAITAVSLALLSNAVLSANRDSEKTQSQLLELLALQESLGDYTLDAIAKEALSGRRGDPVVGTDSTKFTLIPNFSDSKWFWNIRLSLPDVVYRFADLPDEKGPSDFSQKKIRSFGTLNDFRRFFEAISRPEMYALENIDEVSLNVTGLSTKDIPMLLLPNLASPDPSGKTYELGYPSGPATFIEASQGKLNALLKYSIPDDLLESDFNKWLGENNILLENGYKNDVHPIQLIVPRQATRYQVNVDFSSSLQPFLGQWDKRFYALLGLPSEYRKIQLPELKSLLTAQAQRSKGELEVFGAKIPNEIIALFGVPILIILLFQFWAVCSYANSQNDSIKLEDASQWSFLLNAPPFFLMSIGIILILPISSAICSALFISGPSYFPPFVGWIFATVVTLISVLATKHLVRLRNRVRTQPEEVEKSSPERSVSMRHPIRRFPPDSRR
jgi:hypothetical protein